MPKKFTVTEDQLVQIKCMLESGVPQYEIASQFGTTDTMIRKICKENNIETKSMRTYRCIVCGQEFKSTHKSIICKQCKETPAKCVICGKEFMRISPYTQQTCSPECRGKYRAQSGIGKQGAAKMKQTKLARYGTLDPAEVSKAKNGGELDAKECAWCHKIFVPNTPRQIYCNDIHYGSCPVCGKQVQVKDFSAGVPTCSEECRLQKIYATNLEKYGNKYSVNSEHSRQVAKQHMNEKYGVDWYSQTEQFKEAYKETSKKKYGTSNPMQNKDVQAKATDTMRGKYGVEHYLQSEEGKNKMKATVKEKYGGFTLEHSSSSRQKYESTMIERYSASAPMQNPEILAKMKGNNLEKYGTEWATVSKEANEKRRATNLERYGAENPFGSKEIQDKIREGWTQKYGGPNPMCDSNLVELSSRNRAESMMSKYGAASCMQVPELRQKISKILQEKYGVPWYVLTSECRQHNYKSVSKPNRKFAEVLNALGIETSFEYYIGHSPYDIKIEDANVLIEIDPTYTHNCYDNIWHSTKQTYDHLNKTRLAEENGFRCIHIFDWDNQESILSMLAPKSIVYARNCDIQELDRITAEQFTHQYHLQGSCRGQNIVYGLIYKGELIQIMSFGNPRYNKKYDYELLRLCTRCDFKVVGGASRLFSYFKKEHPDSSVISYCDCAKFSGQVYLQLGMELDHISSPAKVWSRGNKYVTDNYLRQQGYDRIFNANYGKGTSNEQLMLEHGWLPVYDCGQKVFVYDAN